MEVKKKVCNMCGVEHLLSEYSARTNKNRCRACVKVKAKEIREKDALTQWARDNSRRNLVGR